MNLVGKLVAKQVIYRPFHAISSLIRGYFSSSIFSCDRRFHASDLCH